MKKPTILKLISLLLVLTFNSCTKEIDGNGVIITKELRIKDFNQISVIGNINIIESDELNVYATGDSNIIDIINERVSNNIWDISFSERKVDDFNLEINIYSPDINSIKTIGSSKIDFESINSETDTLKLDISGSSKIRVLEVDTINYLTIVSSGSGSTELFNLNVNDCNIDISGSGKHRLFVNNNLNATISGSGKLYYKGFPKINSSINGSGIIINDN